MALLTKVAVSKPSNNYDHQLMCIDISTYLGNSQERVVIKMIGFILACDLPISYTDSVLTKYAFDRLHCVQVGPYNSL